MSEIESVATRPGRPRGPRWTDALTVLVLGACTVAVVVVSMPTLLRTAGLGRTRMAPIVETAPQPRGILEGARSRPPVLYYDDEGDEDEGEPVDDLQRLYPEPGNWPGMPSDPDPSAAPVPSGVDSAFGRLRLGAALRPIELLDKPGGGAGVTGELKRGDLVRIVKEQGDWALVLKTGGDAVVMGWSRTSELAIR